MQGRRPPVSRMRCGNVCRAHIYGTSQGLLRSKRVGANPEHVMWEAKYHPVPKHTSSCRHITPGKGETAIQQQTLRPFKHWRGPISSGQHVNTGTG